MNGLSKLPIEKHKIRRRNLKQPKEPAGYFMSPESGPQDTARGAIRTATADRNGAAQCARIQPPAIQRSAPRSGLVNRAPAKLTLPGFSRLCCMLLGIAFLVGGGASTTSVAGQGAVPLVHVLNGGHIITSLAFSSAGRLLVSGGDSAFRTDTRLLKLWDVQTGRLRMVFPEPSVSSVAISRDGRFVASVRVDVKLWDTRSGRFIRSMPRENGVGLCCVVAFSPDGRLIAGEDEIGARTRWVRLWDVRTGALVLKFGGADYGPSVFSFSPDGRMLIVEGGGPPRADPGLFVWDVATGRLIRRLDLLGLATRSLAISSDGTMLATVAGVRAFRTMVLWNLQTGQQLPSPLTIDVPSPPPGGIVEGPREVAFSPTGRFLAIDWLELDPDREVIKLWDIQRQVTTRSLTIWSRPGGSFFADLVSALTFSPDGAWLAAGVGPEIMLWDVRGVLRP